MWTWRRSRYSVALAAAVALASCASVPAVRVPLEAARFGLFPQSEIYFAFELTPQVRAAAETLLPEGARPLLRRAARVYGAASQGALYAAAEGRFSPASLRTALRFKGGWKPVPGSRDRWRAADGSLEAGSPAAGLLVLGSADISPVMARAAAAPDYAMPPQAAAALAGADFYGYLASVPAAMAGGLPIRSAWAAFAGEAGDRFRGDLTLLLAGESGGRLVSLAVRALLTQLLRQASVADYASRLREVSVQADGGVVRVTGLVLSAAEIAAVVQAFGGSAL